jgi:poly-gamma-glutamate synthesis protein (capsule biosynthesis protein)
MAASIAGLTAHAGPEPAPVLPDLAVTEPTVVPAPVDPLALPQPPLPPARADTIELTFVGDIMFGGFFGGVFAPRRPEPGDPLVAVEALLASDLALANLETPVLREVPQSEKDVKKMHFVAAVDQVATLPAHGIRAVSVGNNHQFDMRVAGARETIDNLTELGIRAIGGPRSEAPLVRVETIEVRGWKLGFVAATKVANHIPRPGEPQPVFIKQSAALTEQLVAAIALARKDHDAVIVVLHWGKEFVDAPSSSQIKAAHAFIDAGAIAVIGSHPHVLQGIERYRGGVIAYSLGNFVFRNTYKHVRQTGVLRVALRDDCVDRVEFHPAIQHKKPFYHPEPADPHGFKQVARRMIALSAALRTRWQIDDDRLSTAGGCR